MSSLLSERPQGRDTDSKEKEAENGSNLSEFEEYEVSDRNLSVCDVGTSTEKEIIQIESSLSESREYTA